VCQRSYLVPLLSIPRVFVHSLAAHPECEPVHKAHGSEASALSALGAGYQNVEARQQIRRLLLFSDEATLASLPRATRVGLS
jgi:hypothetical protein